MFVLVSCYSNFITPMHVKRMFFNQIKKGVRVPLVEYIDFIIPKKTK